jgi:hypothetical protein
MARFADFVIKINPEVETIQERTAKVMTALFIRPLKGNMPNIAFFGGKSGRGKSMAVLKIMEDVLASQGIKLLDVLDDVNIYKPTEYTKKWRALLHDDRLKNVGMIAIHESRELVGAKTWHDFLTQTISTVTAISRQIKPISLLIISQDIGDISRDMRKMVDYHIECERKPFGPAKLKWSVIYQDKKDLEKVHLRMRRLRGYVVYADGHMRPWNPYNMVLTLPSQEVQRAFAKADYLAKSVIIDHRFEKMNKQMEKTYGLGNSQGKLTAMVEYYVRNPDMLSQIARMTNKGYKLLPEARTIHELTDAEGTEFLSQLSTRVKDITVAEEATVSAEMHKIENEGHP